MRFITRVLVLLIILIIVQESPVAQHSALSELREGTSFVASMDQSIRASNCKPGDKVKLRVAQAFLAGRDVIPEGAKICGRIVVARKLDKTSKQEALLAVVAERVSWKKKSVPLHAWIVGFGSRKVSTAFANDMFGRNIDRSWWDRFTETTDKPIPEFQLQSLGSREFFAWDSQARTIRMDSSSFVAHIRMKRRPSNSVGAVLIHDDGDIRLPRSLLVVMEQIDTGDPSS